MDMWLLSPCNVYCGNCILYKRNKCLGCAKETAKRETEGKVFCDIHLFVNVSTVVALRNNSHSSEAT